MRCLGFECARYSPTCVNINKTRPGNHTGNLNNNNNGNDNNNNKKRAAHRQ